MTNATARDSITIQGITFQVPQPYEAGDILKANEAGALNQTYAENLRNNFANKVKEAKEKAGDGEVDVDVLQSELDDYAENYEFGVRTGSGRSGDPVMTEAMDIMRDKVRKAIKKNGGSLKDYKPADISARAKAEFVKNSPAAQAVLALAKERVAAQQDIADVELDVA